MVVCIDIVTICCSTRIGDIVCVDIAYTCAEPETEAVARWIIVGHLNTDIPITDNSLGHELRLIAAHGTAYDIIQCADIRSTPGLTAGNVVDVGTIGCDSGSGRRSSGRGNREDGRRAGGYLCDGCHRGWKCSSPL
jgi:hypothetical protein